ncbi:aspartic proteinase nepenthesin-2-like [Phragmites australis]|uniref:aspartic proteinase nepenthesin-2-like n=1 Tax=Phragmites australis TaxID=29695 RepID=UPI002D7871AF|nr:aspartic proteinase nepenthesin-2-like [Phragmites australis]
MGRSLPLVVRAVVVLFLEVQRAGKEEVKCAGKEEVKRAGKDFLKSLFGGQNIDGKLENAADTTGLFIFNLSVGTPSPQNISSILDITSSLVWSQCAPCTACLPPPAPTFQPNLSPTFVKLPCGSQTCQQVLKQTCAADATDDSCGYIAIYDEDTNTTGYLATDTFTFDSTQIPGLVFGCSSTSVGDFSGASGIFGFNRGPLSLVSQLHLSWFSYFLAPEDFDSGVFFQLGGDDNVTWTQNSPSTRLLTSPLHPDLYFVNLTGIRVNGEDLDIPAGTFDFRANGSGGAFLSTTMPVTFLEEAAYNIVRQAFVNSIASQPVNGSELGLDLCYTMQSNVTVPKLTLVFHGTNATMELNKYNYFFADNTTGLECLSILPSPAGVSLSLLGSLLQTGTIMTYDITNEKLIFETAAEPPASSLGSRASLMMVFPLAVCMGAAILAI